MSGRASVSLACLAAVAAWLAPQAASADEALMVYYGVIEKTPKLRFKPVVKLIFLDANKSFAQKSYPNNLAAQEKSSPPNLTRASMQGRLMMSNSALDRSGRIVQLVRHSSRQRTQLRHLLILPQSAFVGP